MIASVMQFYTSTSMQSMDKDTIEAGTSGEVLMARACRKLAGEILFYADATPHPLLFLCGPGNNGGDGFGTAFHLYQRGWPVEIWLTIPESKLKGDAFLFFNQSKSSGIPIREMLRPQSWEHAERFLPPGAWIVDALLGTGTREAPRKALGFAVDFIRKHADSHQIWSIDVPSGLNPVTGFPFDESKCVKADHTLTLGGAKVGFLEDDSDAWTGSISVLDLAFEQEMLSSRGEGNWHTLSDREAAEYLPSYRRGDHKGSHGHALLIGGSPGMSGAIQLSGRAALASGCGLVSILTPHDCASIVDAAIPEAMVLSGEQSESKSLCRQDVDGTSFDAVGIGPGLRVNEGTSQLLVQVLKNTSGALVLDADGLNNFAALESQQQETDAELFFTPHPGEMARLLESNTGNIQEARSTAVRTLSDKHQANALLKGSRSRMSLRDGKNWLNLNGNPGMASGGSGDVLTGLLTGLLARGVDRKVVLPLAVYIHGRAGDLAAHRKGLSGMSAGDIVEAIPKVLQQLQGR